MRYLFAIIGPVGSAAAQFMLSLAVLRELDPASFGRFSFLLIASQISLGVWSALLCAPLPILLTTGDAASRVLLLRCLATINLIGAVFAFAIFLAIGLLLGQSLAAAILFAGYVMFALLRWFARAQAYAVGARRRTIISDAVYSAALLAAVALIVVAGTATLELACAALLASALLAMIPFGQEYLREQFLRLSLSEVNRYTEIWREHSGWSLFGVLTTEATANAHSYLVTLLLGPGAFAPIAASALLVRPISVAMNGLVEFERAQMAQRIGAGHVDQAMNSVRFFRGVLIAAWIATAFGAVGIFYFFPRLIFPPHYDLHFLIMGSILWMAVVGIRMLRTPDNVLLQAAGAFRPLAYASAWSAGVSIAAVLILLILGGPLLSIAGVFAGEMVFAISTWRQVRRWRAMAEAAQTDAPP